MLKNLEHSPETRTMDVPWVPVVAPGFYKIIYFKVNRTSHVHFLSHIYFTHFHFLISHLDLIHSLSFP